MEAAAEIEVVLAGRPECAASGAERRSPASPSPAKPSAIKAQVEGSGAAVVEGARSLAQPW